MNEISRTLRQLRTQLGEADDNEIKPRTHEWEKSFPSSYKKIDAVYQALKDALVTFKAYEAERKTQGKGRQEYSSLRGELEVALKTASIVRTGGTSMWG
jgi:hypothetical protein